MKYYQKKAVTVINHRDESHSFYEISRLTHLQFA